MKQILIIIMVIIGISNLYSENKLDSIYADIHELLVNRHPPLCLKYASGNNKLVLVQPHEYIEHFFVEKLPYKEVLPNCKFDDFFGIYRISVRQVSDGDNIILIKYGEEYYVYEETEITAIVRHFYNLMEKDPNIIKCEDIKHYLKELLYPQIYGALYGKKIEQLKILKVGKILRF